MSNKDETDSQKSRKATLTWNTFYFKYVDLFVVKCLSSLRS